MVQRDTETQKTDSKSLAKEEFSLQSESFARVKYQFEHSGFVVLDTLALGLPKQLSIAVDKALELNVQGSYLPSIDHSELVFIKDGKCHFEPGQEIHSLASSTTMVGIAGMFGGTPQKLWHATMNIAKQGEHHPTHRDWRATNPIWLSMIRQSHYDGPPVLHVRDKTTGNWTPVDCRGDKWVVLDAFTDHRVATLPAARRSFVLSYAPQRESLRDIQSKDFQWREDIVPRPMNIR